MHNARFGTGVFVCAGLLLCLIIGTVGGASARSSVLEGTVSIEGRPPTQGVVVFESLDRNQSGDIYISVAPDGRFQRRIDWPQGMSGRTRFRVFLVVGHNFSRQRSEVSLGAEPTRVDIALKD